MKRSAWIGLAVVFFLAAVVVSPSLVPDRLDGRAERLRGDLIQGLVVVRAALAAGGLLALLSAWWWRIENSPDPVAAPPILFRDVALAAGLFLGGAALGIWGLGFSLWWDELTSLVLVVRNGPAAVLAYSAKANNHPLNSALMYVVRAAFGEAEPWLRLPSFLMYLGLIQAVFWTLRRDWQPGKAALAAVVAGLSPWIVIHGSEARGYAGAILCSYLACWLFAQILRRPSPRLFAAYVVCATASIGFILTTVLVPVAHGLIALSACCRRDPRQRRLALTTVLACGWVGVLAGVCFGLPVPQTLAYARGDALSDHLRFGLPLLQETFCYLSGIRPAIFAAFMLALAATGWFLGGLGLTWRLAFLGPVVVAIGEAALPGVHSSPRFFCFLLEPMALGLASLLSAVFASGRLGRIAAAGLVLAWVSLSGTTLGTFLMSGNPDLRGTAARLDTKKVVLTGSQADMNAYYFPGAKVLPLSVREAIVPEQLAGVEWIVQGTVKEVLPDPRLARMGFECLERLESGVKGRTSYLIYRRIR